MKILMINPPLKIQKNFINYPIFPNLGLLLASSILERKGYDVKILDALFLNSKLEVSERRDGYHIGASQNEIKKRIKKIKPDAVAIANTRFFDFNTLLNPEIIDLFRYIKQIDSKNLTILADFFVGGFDYVQFSPKLALKKINSIDIVDFGEAEYSIPQIINSFRQDKSFEMIDGIAYRKAKKIFINAPKKNVENLDELPFPAYHLMNTQNYFKVIKDAIKKGFIHEHSTSKRLLPLYTSRGCPYSCIFCASYPYGRRKWRANSANYIIKEVRHFINEYGVEHFSFMDDNMNADMERFEKIVNGFVKNKFEFTWNAPNGLRADKLNKKILVKMQKTGFSHLFISAESGDQEILNNVIKKKLDLSAVIDIAKACKEIGLPLSVHYMIGLPGEKIRNIKKTLSFALDLYKKYKARPSVQYATPIEGTELYNICKKNNYFAVHPSSINIPHAIMGEGVIKTEDFDPRGLKYLIRSFKNEL